MIKSFGNALAEDLFYNKKSKHSRSFPAELYRQARRKLLYLHDASELKDLRVPPGNRLEALKGDRLRQYSIRINDRWRICFVWELGDVYEVEIVDYH